MVVTLISKRLRGSAATADSNAVDEAISDLVAANRILADEGVLDGFGHVSVRHPLLP